MLYDRNQHLLNVKNRSSFIERIKHILRVCNKDERTQVLISASKSRLGRKKGWKSADTPAKSWPNNTSSQEDDSVVNPPFWLAIPDTVALGDKRAAGLAADGLLDETCCSTFRASAGLPGAESPSEAVSYLRPGGVSELRVRIFQAKLT